MKKNNLQKSREIKIKKEIKINDDELAPIDLVPKLTKEGYKCSPSIMELSRKTAYELRNVENFRIFNKYGEVQFKEPVNLLGLNLDNQVIIEKNLIIHLILLILLLYLYSNYLILQCFLIYIKFDLVLLRILL